MITLAYAVVITVVIALTYSVLEYYFVPKHGSNSGWAMASVFMFLVMIGAIIISLGLAIQVISAGV